MLIKNVKCTFWQNGGSKIIENKLVGYFFQFLAPVGGPNHEGAYHYPFPNIPGLS